MAHTLQTDLPPTDVWSLRKYAQASKDEVSDGTGFVSVGQINMYYVRYVICSCGRIYAYFNTPCGLVSFCFFVVVVQGNYKRRTALIEAKVTE